MNRGYALSAAIVVCDKTYKEDIHKSKIENAHKVVTPTSHWYACLLVQATS